MKIKVRTLRKMIREALQEHMRPEPVASATYKDSQYGVEEDDSPRTKRGGAGLPVQSNDDFEPEAKTKRGMGLEPTIEDLFGDWDDHMGVEVDIDFDDDEKNGPRTKRSAGVEESDADLSPNRNQEKDTQYPRK